MSKPTSWQGPGFRCRSCRGIRHGIGPSLPEASRQIFTGVWTKLHASLPGDPDLVATMKLIRSRRYLRKSRHPLRDSIVRGTQLKNYTIKKLWECGAKESMSDRLSSSSCFRVDLPFHTVHRGIGGSKGHPGHRGKNVGDVREYVDHRSKKFQQMWSDREGIGSHHVEVSKDRRHG